MVDILQVARCNRLGLIECEILRRYSFTFEETLNFSEDVKLSLILQMSMTRPNENISTIKASSERHHEGALY